MNVRRGLVLATTITGLMSVAAPAWAVTEEYCLGSIGGEVGEDEGSQVCVFPEDDAEDCADRFDGIPNTDGDYCIAPITAE